MRTHPYRIEKDTFLFDNFQVLAAKRLSDSHARALSLITASVRNLFLQLLNHQADALQKPSQRQGQILPVHAVHGVFDTQAKLGIAFNPNPALKEQGIRIGPAGRQQNKIRALAADAYIVFQACVQSV